jgi:hypothetical protein
MFTLPERFKQAAKTEKVTGILKSPLPYFAFAFVVIGGTIFFHTIPQTQSLESAKQKIASNEEGMKTIQENIQTKEIEIKRQEEQLILLEDKYRPRIEKVLPYEEGITEMTRFIEYFALQLEKAGPFELSTVSYG